MLADAWKRPFLNGCYTCHAYAERINQMCTREHSHLKHTKNRAKENTDDKWAELDTVLNMYLFNYSKAAFFMQRHSHLEKWSNDIFDSNKHRYR